MRKVCLKFFLILILFTGVFGISQKALSSELKNNQEILSHKDGGGDWRFEKVLIGDKWWIFVYFEDRLIDAFPDDCGSGGGGN